MPYPNEHSARLQEPSRFNPDTFRRKNDGTIYGKIKVPNTVAVIWGKLKKADKPADKPIPQALRFPTSSWTAEKAKKWLKDNNVKYIRFEPASGGKKSEAEPITGELATARMRTILAELKAEYWVMEDHHLEQLFFDIASKETAPPVDVEIEVKERPMQITGSTAVIPIKGVLMRKINAVLSWYGIEQTSYETIAGQVAEAVANDSVESILLDVDSPGGTVPGVAETAEVIRQARQVKPVKAVIDDLGASGAYWLASQANQIEAVPNGMAGSIGVFSVYLDRSAMAEKLGIKVIVVRSGEHKGMGVPGAEITKKQIAAVQEIIDGIADNFIADVAAGRSKDKSKVSDWATGQLWLADKAASLGVIDSVRKTKTKVVKEKVMEEMTDQQIDAQIAENEKKAIEQEKEKAVNEERQRAAKLKDAFADDPEFAVKAIAEGWTVEKAKSEYCDVLKERLKEQVKVSDQKKEKPTGAEAIATEGNDDQIGDDFLTVAKKLAEEKKITMTVAMRHLARTKPDLHRAFKERCKTEGHQIYSEAV